MIRLRAIRPASLIFALCLAAGFAAAQSATWKIDPKHSSVEFQIRHLAVSNVRGNFSKTAGTVLLNDTDITKSRVEATIDVNSLSTNEPSRDKHLSGPEFFDVQKNPTITFKSTSITKNSGKLQMTGDLTLAGVTKSVTLDMDGPAAPQKGPQGQTASGFSATGKLSRKDFNFGSKYSSPAIGDEVKFTIDIEMDKE